MRARGGPVTGPKGVGGIALAPRVLAALAGMPALGATALAAAAALAATAILAAAPTLAAASAATAAAPGAAPAAPVVAPDKPPEPAATIPVPEVARRADEVMALLRTLDSLVTPSPDVAAIEQRLPDAAARLTERLDETRRVLDRSPALGALSVLDSSWRATRLELAGWIETLARRATQLERESTRLAALRERWMRARADARTSRAPAPVVERIDSVLVALAQWRERLDAERGAVLLLQDRVARELARSEDVLASIARARQEAAAQLFSRESPAIWSGDLRARIAEELPGRIRAAIAAGRAQVAEFVRKRPGGLLAQLALFVGVAPLLAAARRKARKWDPANPRVASAVHVLDRPVAGALVLALLFSLWLYPQDAIAVHTLMAIGTLVPMVVIMRCLVDPVLVPGVYAIGAFFLVDRVRALLEVEPMLEQWLTLLEMLAATSVLAVTVLSRRGRVAAHGGSSWRHHAFEAGTRLALVGTALALVAAAVGSMRLARLVASSVATSSYLGLVLYTGVRVADAIVLFLLRARPLRQLQSVARHRPWMEQRAHALLAVAAGAAWGFITFDFLGLLRPLVAVGRRVLEAGVTRGSTSVTVGDVLAFALTIVLACLVSALVRFVLEEDVYPRLRLAEGLPFALSSLLNYAILFVGFLLALAALGLDLNRVTILGGALGVGIGFGLQNVVNNFVSGLIVLFERPIRVGDAVQIGDLVGEVRRIGIRSSTMRTLEGAEVIVPNAQFVSDRVTNWTLSDRMRRIDLSVGLAYGIAPDKALELLREVARAHPDVVAEPAPLALFLGFGDSALNFELRVWTDRLERWLIVRSELGVALYAALRDAGMEIPFPQQDVHLRRDPPGPGGAQ